MNKRDILERFGEIYITFVRDSVLEQARSIIDKTAKAPGGKRLGKNLDSFSPQQLKICKELISEFVDSCLHYVLFMLEEYRDEMCLIIKTKDRACSLIDISDGLSGELYGEDGWIKKYTKYPDWKEEMDLYIEPPKSRLWSYLDNHYHLFLQKKGLYQIFLEGNSEVYQKIIEIFKDEIFLNYCPNCGNLKETPQARYCLKCRKFHEPQLV